MRAITLHNVSKTYADRKPSAVHAIAGVNLHIHAGEAVALLGPSGCGKTTLLRLIAGLERPDSGEILYDKQSLDRIPIAQRGIGMVFQDYVLVPHWESRKTVGFFLRLRKREAEVPARVRTVAKITGVGISDLMGRYPRELSGGEKQRVAIARAFARDLRLLLFDEPFANLDAKFRAQARLELKRLIREFRATLVYVTHDQVEAMNIADRIVLLDGGSIAQMGSYRELYNNPDSLFVAEFLGSPAINCFRGRVRQGLWHGGSMGSAELPSPRDDGEPVIAAVRPRHIRINEHEGIPAIVERAVPFYAEKYYLLEVSLRKRRWQVQAPLSALHAMGDRIFCQIDWNHAFFFDARTGQRIR